MQGKNHLRFLVICLSLFLMTGYLLADNPRDGNPASPLITCTQCLPYTCADTFWIYSAAANYPNDTVVACSARVRIPDKVVDYVYMEIKWNSQDLEYDSIQFPIGTGYIQHQGSDSINFRVDVPNQTYSNRTTVAKLWFTAKCFSSTQVSFVKYCQETYFVEQGGANWGPNLWWQGTVTRPVPPHTMRPLRDSSTVNDTLRMPVLYSCTTTASAGFVSTWEYPKDSLDFIDVIGTGYLGWNNPSGTANESSNPATLKISYSGYVYPPGTTEDTLFFIRFKNTMGKVNSEAKVVRLTDTLKFCDGPNTDVLGIITNRDSANARTFYSAEFKFKDTSAVKNSTNVPFRTQLKNNFIVQLKTSSNISRFRIDDSLWTLITWYNWNNADTTRKWVQEYGGPNKKYKNDPGTQNDIPKSDSFVTTVNQVVNVGSVTGTQYGNVIDSNYTKLKDAIANITATAGNGLALTTGAFTVTGGGGGCPFVYTWDGTKFVEDNTILATSEFSPFSTPITDLYRLTQPLVESNGEYLLQIREFENEETQLDEVELIAVDHPPAVKVSVTPEGKILAYDKVLFPVSCVDNEGKDQLDLITAKDGNLFESKGPGYLLLTFNKPQNKELPNYVRPMPAESTDACCDQKRIGVNNRVIVEVEDYQGHWHTLGDVVPRANADRAYWVLGTNDIQLGEQFRVKLSWNLDYKTDWMPFCWPTAQVWHQESIKPRTAVHSNQGDISVRMGTADGNSAKLVPGESINLRFPVTSSKPEGMVRDFVFKSVGYYKRYDKSSTAGAFTYKLNNNYPNPFNAQTEIQYALPEPSEVNLSVYNIMGQKVRTLVEGRQSAGVHKVTWDGRSEKGETVASGVYFYTLRAGTYIETKKMTLLK